MGLDPGRRLGSYTVVAQIGAGGMGEVYRAEDARLGRDVAVKVLPSEFARDPERLRRFSLEAKAAAALSHPNVLSVYDVGHDGDTGYVVSELLEGQTLRDRLLREGRLPPRKAIEYAIQICQGLAAAHAKGIVHRDLKPENLFLTDDERVKILDFGLAKLTETDASALTESLTADDVVLGTAGYMSPEQVRGLPADHRSDIFSFGAVLFEMITGRRAFARPTAVQAMAAIVGEDPQETPPPGSALAARALGLARRCLEKSPQARFQSAADLALVLANELADSGTGPATTAVPRHARLRMAVAVASVIGLVALSAWLWLGTRPGPAAPTPVAFGIALPDGSEPRELAISRDGTRIAWAAEQDGQRQLFVRTLDNAEIRSLPGTEGAFDPFFSPDGSVIGFFSAGSLRRVPVSGGAPTIICVAPSGRGGSWTFDDRIVFAPDARTGLSIVSASGGTPEPLTMLDRARGEDSHRNPIVLPDRQTVLFNVFGISVTDVHIGGVKLGTEGHRVVLASARHPQYVESGHLVYADQQGQMFAAPFDPSQLRVTGTAVPLQDRPRIEGATVAFAISDSGTAVSAPPRTLTQSLVVADPLGTRRPLDVTPRPFFSIRLSPDGHRLAAVVIEGTNRDIWTLDLAAPGSLVRLTTGKRTSLPIWAADNRTLTYPSFEAGSWRALSQTIESGRPPIEAHDFGAEREPFLLGWMPDGTLLYTLNGPRAATYAVASGQAPREVGATPVTVTHVAAPVSPDGRWQAWVSDQSGQFEVYVTAFPDGGIIKQVSLAGGFHPVWSKSGSELYFRRGQPRVDGAIMRTTVATDGSTKTPTDVGITGFHHGSLWSQNYDVLPDGSFVLLMPTSTPNGPQIDVVVNWATLRGLGSGR